MYAIEHNLIFNPCNLQMILSLISLCKQPFHFSSLIQKCWNQLDFPLSWSNNVSDKPTIIHNDN